MLIIDVDQGLLLNGARCSDASEPTRTAQCVSLVLKLSILVHGWFVPARFALDVPLLGGMYILNGEVTTLGDAYATKRDAVRIQKAVRRQQMALYCFFGFEPCR